jgi:hypothetical protein
VSTLLVHKKNRLQKEAGMGFRRPAALNRLGKLFRHKRRDEEQSHDSHREPPIQHKRRSSLAGGGDVVDYQKPEEAANLEKHALVIKRGFKRWFEKAMSLNRVQLLMRIKLEIDLGWAFL